MMKKFVVAAINSSNFFQLRETRPGIYEGVGGIEYELLKILSQMLKFKFEIVIPEDGQWGHENSDGMWTGLTGMLQRQEADMVVEFTTITYKRFQVVDFAFPHALDRVSFVSEKAGIASNDFVYFRPFQKEVWIYLVVSILLSCLLFASLRYLNNQTSRIGNYFYETIAAVQLVTGYLDLNTFGQSYSTRIFFGALLLCMRFLVLSFCAVFLSFLMAPILEFQIENFEELAEASRNGEVKVTTIGGTFLQNLIMDDTNHLLRDLSVHLKQHPESYVKAGVDTVKIVLDGFFLIDNMRVMLVNAHEMGKSERLFYSDDTLHLIPIAISFRKGFCCIQEFNKMISRLHQSGTLTKLLSDHLNRLRAKHPPEEDEVQKLLHELKPIPYSKIRGILGIALAFYLLAFLVFIIELIWKKYSEKPASISSSYETT